jgi:serine protease Do
MSSTSASRLTARLRPAALGLVTLFGAGLVWAAGFRTPAAGARGPDGTPQGASALTGAAVSAPRPILPVSTESYADLASRVGPSIVTVRSERLVRLTNGGSSQPDERLFRRFFGDDPRPHQERGLGSGVVVSPDGYILTNQHVVDGAAKIVVDLVNRRTFEAKLVGSDPGSDLAVLKIEAQDLAPLPLGDSNAVRVGDVVLAFGNPLGVGQTVTMGIISAKGRATGLGDGSFEDFLQTDAPINQGNSGGALVNIRGELVGINSQIVSPSGGNIGIGFAIPAAMAGDVMQQLIHGGRVHRGQIGVSVQTVNSEIAASLGLAAVKGAIVSSVSPGSPAQAAGIERGDVIVRLNGAEVVDANALRNQIASSTPGSTASLTVMRTGHERTLSVKLRELRDVAHTTDAGESLAKEGGPLGLSVRPLVPEERAEYGLGHTGLFVAGVDPEGPASGAGFQAGDVISEVNGKVISDPAGLRAAVESAGSRPSLVLVNRGKDSLYLTLPSRG